MIALVVTIVVLIILAAVGISLSVGDNGIIIGAKDAAEKWQGGEDDEKDKLNDLSEYITNNTEGKTVSSVKGGDKFENTETIKDDDGREVTIPGGFGVSEDSGTKVDEGIVITDGVNEFVWTPIDDPNEMFIEETVNLKGVTTKIDLYTAARIRPGEEFKQGKPSNETLFAVREPDVLSQLDTNSQYYNKILNFDSVQEMADSFAQEYKSMSDSIKKYHGFYIGRYELTGTVGNPTTKEGTVIDMNWYDAYKTCQNVIKDSQFVKSTMVYGCQWDEVMKWLKNTKFKGEEYKVDSDSSSWGNYGTGVPIDTGSNPKYEVNKIFDLAGNYKEWTQEATYSNARIDRGGYFGVEGSNAPASDRNLDVSTNITTSRAVIYML